MHLPSVHAQPLQNNKYYGRAKSISDLTGKSPTLRNEYGTVKVGVTVKPSLRFCICPCFFYTRTILPICLIVEGVVRSNPLDVVERHVS